MLHDPIPFCIKPPKEQTCYEGEKYQQHNWHIQNKINRHSNSMKLYYKPQKSLENTQRSMKASFAYKPLYKF